MKPYKHAFLNIDPEFAGEVKTHFYMDDLNSGAQSTKEGFGFSEKVKNKFLQVSFNIRKWGTKLCKYCK